MIFLNVLFPILVLVSVGYFLARRGYLDGEKLSKLSFWFLSPALIFSGLLENEIAPEIFFEFAIFIVLSSLIMWFVALSSGRLAKLGSDTSAALALSLVFPNSGNYGLPLLLFAFGEEAFALGVVYISVSTFVMSTLGVVISTWGESFSFKPFLNIFKTPIFYAVVLAVIIKSFEIEIPLFVIRPIDLLAQAAIPMLLVLLGTQLIGVQLGKRIKLISYATVLRLAAAPLFAWGLVTLLGFTGLLYKVAIIESSMPVAVNALVLATFYGRDPRLVSSVVLTTTALSIISLTILLLLLGA
jgi:hypothetical protein